MNYFNYYQQQLFAEQVSITDIVQQYGSPCYIYSRTALEQQWQAFDQAFADQKHLICYAVKANSNLAILNILAQLGSGFDIVSGGELKRVLAAGGDPKKIVFSGVGKTETELRDALIAGIHCFNIEVSDELDRLNRIAHELGVIAPISLRVNPNVDAQTHPYISTGLKENKFGISSELALQEYLHAASLSNLKIIGIDCHIGSQLTEIQPFLSALDKILELVAQLKQQNIEITHLDLGGGLGVRYQNEQPPLPQQYIQALLSHLNTNHYQILLEPGRSIVANAGILVTKVEYLKTTPAKNFAIVDAAMNDLIRPALYNAWQQIIPVQLHSKASINTWDIVGPICETGDFLAKQRELALEVNDLLAICSAGAYGFSMSSNYNSRPRIAEIMVHRDQSHLIRARETYSQLWENEYLID
ncbi:MAG: diaminopimelate decarboxylase [Pseudomonadota bacterium]|jgi:diaminopimelate decarboxylase